MVRSYIQTLKETQQVTHSSEILTTQEVVTGSSLHPAAGASSSPSLQHGLLESEQLSTSVTKAIQTLIISSKLGGGKSMNLKLELKKNDKRY